MFVSGLTGYVRISGVAATAIVLFDIHDLIIGIQIIHPLGFAPFYGIADMKAQATFVSDVVAA